MSRFSEATERARARDAVSLDDEQTWTVVEGYLKYFEIEAEKRRQTHRRAGIIAYAAYAKAKESRPYNRIVERELLDKETLETAQARRPKMSEFDIGTLAHRGFVLCERVDTDEAIEVRGRRIDLPRLTGLIVSTHGQIFKYSSDLDINYPKKRGINAWGTPRADLYDGEARIIGEVTRLRAPADDEASVNAYDARLHAVTGALDLEDLLAGLVVRYELEPEQFEDDRWTSYSIGDAL